MKLRLYLMGMASLLVVLTSRLPAQTQVQLLEVPDYGWHYGCFGTAGGNLIGFWDRNGMPDFYRGPTGGGVAPLRSSGADAGIVGLWASKAGLDGRPADQPGHVDDYWITFESLAPDPYLAAGRPEHAPDCLGDFIGLSQWKWTNMNNECDGNIDGYSFVFWETNGLRRANYVPTDAAGSPVPDIPSGLRDWARHHGQDADVFSQLTDFNPTVPSGAGFSFEDMKAEINAGFPVLLFLQSFSQYFLPATGIGNVNPPIHGMLAYGYKEDPALGIQWVYYRTSWASGPGRKQWNAANWEANLPVRGVIGFHPKPKLGSLTRTNGLVTLTWTGPSAKINDVVNQTTNAVHYYRVQWSPDPGLPGWDTVGTATTNQTSTFAEPTSSTAFYRVVLGQP